MNDREFITSIRDQCNAQLGGDTGSAPGTTVAAITSKPQLDGDLGSGNDAPSEKQVAPSQVVGYSFTTRNNVHTREIKFFGKPGQFWHRCSWAVFDSGGTRIMGEDNLLVSGNLGWGTGAHLTGLGAGTYTFAVAVDGSGNLATQFNQH